MNRIRWASQTACLILPLCWPGSTLGASTAPATAPATLPAAAIAIASSSNAFGVDLFNQVSQAPGNALLSPISLSSALAMTYAGARGRTADEMAHVLHFPPGQNVHGSFGQLLQGLRQSQQNGLQLDVANALWADRAEPLLQSYIDLLRDHYHAGLSRLSFAQPVEAAGTINHWVAKQTHDKIDTLVQPGDLNMRGPGGLVLTNAVYFKGTWAAQFDPELTKPAPFRINAATSKDVPMMRQTSRFRHVAAGPYDMIELPYVGNQVSMIILLPRDTRQPDAAASGPADAAALSSLSSDSLHQWLQALDQQKPAQLVVLLPKFKTTGSYKLRDTLPSMGMAAAFSGGDFSGISEWPAAIPEVIHKTLTEVNEESTEAAAATAVVLGRSGAPQFFRVDHPFLFLIRHNPSGTILFLGRIVDPSTP